MHDRLQAADPGEVRDALLAALRKGAPVRLWIHGPSASLARHHANLDSLTEGTEPAIAAFDTTKTIGLACVEDDAWTSSRFCRKTTDPHLSHVGPARSVDEPPKSRETAVAIKGT
ncbi:hypothetical protein ACFVZH_35900 [Streptomyces sp. NPDC059534]|uniref:hypothetical protein n=1 Tax=Streptomyces sp. NPDC059534 TaxID=3346859 RepID=UPI0036BBD97C